MRRFSRALALSLAAAVILSGQTSLLRLKNTAGSRTLPVVGSPSARLPVKSWSRSHYHVLAEFLNEAGVAAARRLEEQGARLVQYVPDLGYILSVSRDTDLRAFPGVRLYRLTPENKLSAALEEPASPAVGVAEIVAEFYPDVDAGAARAVAAAAGFEVVHHPDLLGNHLLLRGDRGKLGALAEWDEVAYLFPASDDLKAGRPVAACPGALTEASAVGQYVATVGDGWDGPGRGRASLGYFFQSLARRLPAELAREEIRRAFDEWARVAAVSFSPAASSGSSRSVNVLFGGGGHGDPYPFDGQGGVLAHTFYPAPPNPESIAGDMHFDDDEEWVAGAESSPRSVDLFSVALHELGHALGLGHSDVPGSVMYPYYRRATALTQTDIDAILTLYAAASPDSEPAGPQALSLSIYTPSTFPLTTAAASLAFAGEVSGGTGDAGVSWSSDRAGAGVASGGRNWSIAALPLQVGTNTITITATDAAAQRVSKTVTVIRQSAASPPSIRITSPTSSAAYTTSSAFLTVAGSASAAAGIARVEWTSSRGPSGVAVGTAQWSAGPIPLQPGQNVLTFTVRDADGGAASQALTVTMAAAGDNVAPTLSITSPSTTTVLTSAATIRLAGTARDNVGVTAVTWTTSSGASGTAYGTTYWTASDVPLLVGANVIVVRAHDAAGNTSWRSVTVTRR